MATQMQLGESQIRDFQVLRDLGTDVLSSVVQHLDGLDPVPLNPNELFVAIKGCFEGDGRSAECVMRQALSLNGLMRQTEMDLDAVLAAIQTGIERDAQWSPHEVENWKLVEPTFRELLRLKAFRLVATTIDLSYEYANLFRTARILTDSRPLFSRDADAIEGAVVSNTLRLRFESVDGAHELSIAMDEGDVRDLAEQCERALKKARTARETMSNRVEIPTIVTGERSDA